VWFSIKTNGDWGEAHCLCDLIHTKEIHAPTVASNGNIYDDGIIRFQYINGGYLASEKIPALEGAFPFVSPDESYIIYTAQKPGKHDFDLYISFRSSDHTWSEGISLGNEINSEANEGNSYVTPDDKYIFYSRNYDIYWVSANIIEELRLD
jgi:hypothetical protein